jgi:2,4-dienoyl-CoA reductase-like NADH-dependent reductase (Old Yellow Enzyme family)
VSLFSPLRVGGLTLPNRVLMAPLGRARANGSLIDQFLRDGASRRQDAFGGSVEARGRFLLAVVDTVVPVLGAERVSVRLAPHATADGTTGSTPSERSATSRSA